MKKVIALFLCLVMLASTVCSCNRQTDENPAESLAAPEKDYNVLLRGNWRSEDGLKAFLFMSRRQAKTGMYRKGAWSYSEFMEWWAEPDGTLFLGSAVYTFTLEDDGRLSVFQEGRTVVYHKVQSLNDPFEPGSAQK